MMLVVAAILVGWEVAQNRRRRRREPLGTPWRVTVYAGLQKTLPMLLFLTFLLVPSTSTRIFKTFLCVPFEYDKGTTRRYLHDDFTLRCDSSSTYNSTQTIAIALMVVWPLG